MRPGIPFKQQKEEDLLWIREDFLLHERDYEKIVVHGHTPVAEPDVAPIGSTSMSAPTPPAGSHASSSTAKRWPLSDGASVEDQIFHGEPAAADAIIDLTRRSRQLADLH